MSFIINTGILILHKSKKNKTKTNPRHVICIPKISIQIHHHVETVSWPLKISNLSSEKQTKGTKENNILVSTIYILYIYIFVLLYQPNIWYIMCCYGLRSPATSWKSTMIKVKTLIPQLHPASVCVCVCVCFFCALHVLLAFSVFVLDRRLNLSLVCCVHIVGIERWGIVGIV